MQGLLKFITCGSVDDGKSTLIGHMLYDAKLIFADQEKALELDSKVGSTGGDIDYSLLLDGLMAEREQGITIDVAYRYFTTEKRSFIVADTPGHEEYTRNMAVGASFADLAVILVDASQGVLIQTKRHTRICNLVGIRNFVFAVNKMDLINYDKDTFDRIKKEIRMMTAEYDLDSLHIIPVSATVGDNVTVPSEKMNWYKGPTLLSYLEDINVRGTRDEVGFIMPVQRVVRPDHTFRGFQGQIEAGDVKVGDEITVLPSHETAHVKSIHVCDKKCDDAVVGEPCTIELDREVDVSRGCVLYRDRELEVSNLFLSNLLWMDDSYLVAGKNFFLKVGTKLIPASVTGIKYKIDVNEGTNIPCERIYKNEIAKCEIAVSEKIVFDEFEDCQALGSFILIDRVTNMTSACGIVLHSMRRSDNLVWQELDISRDYRANSLGQEPKTIWFTGLSGSGKSTLANALEKKLALMGKHTMLLDGDNVRMGLNSNLGFKEQDRIENIRRIAEVAKLMNDAGLITLTSFISPYANDRARAKDIIGNDSFVEIYVATPIEECEKRDVKGLYEKARNGQIPNFTGITSPYEAPENPDLTINTVGREIDDCVDEIIKYLGLEA
ncbi:MAG: adenylyl-sulfate kinase [Lachnospiraceae bacterium]|nr:adenylyl-sulfate kinase [Lachnospiraceae bacterium]